MYAVLLAILEEKDVITEKEAEKLHEKLKYAITPAELKDARLLIKNILK